MASTPIGSNLHLRAATNHFHRRIKSRSSASAASDDLRGHQKQISFPFPRSLHTRRISALHHTLLLYCTQFYPRISAPSLPARSLHPRAVSRVKLRCPAPNSTNLAFALPWQGYSTTVAVPSLLRFLNHFEERNKQKYYRVISPISFFFTHRADNPLNKGNKSPISRTFLLFPFLFRHQENFPIHYPAASSCFSSETKVFAFLATRARLYIPRSYLWCGF